MNGEDAFKKLPVAEQKIRRKLGQALIRFVSKLAEMVKEGLEEKMSEIAMGLNPGDKARMDDKLRRQLTQNFRVEVERAAKQGVEGAFFWHTLGTWTELGKERIGCFARALECAETGSDALPGMPEERGSWNDVLLRAGCLYEIGRVHAHEGDAAVARDFLMRALPLAQEGERLQRAAGVEPAENLEGKIAELLVQLPDEGEAT